MSSSNDAPDRRRAIQLNADLRSAQLDLLSAQCASDRLRLRFSPDDLVRFGHRDVIHKAANSASALHEFYSKLERIVQTVETAAAQDGLAEDPVRKAVTQVASYLREQREHYLSESKPLGAEHRAFMDPFFSPSFLAGIRVVEIPGLRQPEPLFYAEAKATGVDNLPDLAQMPSLTFENVLVFQYEMTPRSLFHGLVHAVQLAVLGLEGYTELLVRGFYQTQSFARVPLEAHVVALESAFAADPAKSFSVEEQVRLWVNQHRYELPHRATSAQ